MRPARTTWKTCALGAVAAVAVLSATACDASGKDDGANATGSSATATATPTASASASTPASEPATAAPTATASGSTAPTATAPAAPGAAPSASRTGTVATAACADQDLSISTSYWRQDSGQNMLITATNVTGKPCTLHHYPYIYFRDADQPIPSFGPRPQAVATIRPHQKAYAGVHLFRAGEPTGNAVEQFGIGYQDRAPGSNRDVAALDVRAPEGGANVGPHPKVTYWNLSRSAVEDIVFRSDD
ncbi:DUF4232 domain-containing protein [Streptomyces sp. B1866]|uniref:DUF4232 domain-containing protein n=1 Tax=Streptomyces sp. B1866 TaxID=3075431 RepID=UPI00288EC833|nr:DUF4232 domain-containing protein [Streptomyces sp. B1866]MDT3396605.1 DUF4232 domain-containing protein [Streptomyces sp. B1866]